MKKEIFYKPVFLKNEAELKKMLKQKPYISFVDAFSDQLKELFFIENHKYIGEDKNKIYSSEVFKKYCFKKAKNFKYVYYPWNHTIVKTVPKEAYWELKTNRNQDLITVNEQKKLRDFSVGVFGMSVGSNIAFVLTQAGISNSITIADFDELSTTNLNRILAGVHQIGLNKTVIAARRIYEDNPFADVKTMSSGVSVKNLEALLKRGKLKCLMEEIDNLPMKIEIRILAMKYKVPVIMVTDNGDGVVLHVERYDKNLKTIFNKPLTYWKTFLSGNITKEKIGKMIIEDIFGGAQNASLRVMDSVQKVFNKEIISWPQLGSAAILGGVISTIIIKKIVNKEEMPNSFVKHIQHEL